MARFRQGSWPRHLAFMTGEGGGGKHVGVCLDSLPRAKCSRRPPASSWKKLPIMANQRRGSIPAPAENCSAFEGLALNALKSPHKKKQKKNTVAVVLLLWKFTAKDNMCYSKNTSSCDAIAELNWTRPGRFYMDISFCCCPWHRRVDNPHICSRDGRFSKIYLFYFAFSFVFEENFILWSRAENEEI